METWDLKFAQWLIFNTGRNIDFDINLLPSILIPRCIGRGRFIEPLILRVRIEPIEVSDLEALCLDDFVDNTRALRLRFLVTAGIEPGHEVVYQLYTFMFRKGHGGGG
jgi:hypothetical protein